VSGQRLLYRLGSRIGLVSVLVLQFCALKLIFKLISGKKCIADCAPSFELVRRRKNSLGLVRILSVTGGQSGIHRNVN